jgi:hypothetical protein
MATIAAPAVVAGRLAGNGSIIRQNIIFAFGVNALEFS